MSRVRLYLPRLVGVPGCLAAGWFELGRALAGRTVAWVYAVEWPLFAVMGVYVWWRTRDAADPSTQQWPPSPARAPAPVAHQTADPALAAWQAYLAELHAADPPGGPALAPRATYGPRR